MDVEKVEVIERMAEAMADVIAKRHGHERDDWLNDERRAEARAALEASPVSELLEALEPFAREADEWDADVPNHIFPEVVAIDGSRGSALFNVGHLRRARTLVSQYRGGKA